MEIRLTIVLILAILSIAWAKPKFVQEICRHGARAPEVDYPYEGFPNGKGMLTSSGLRQHYLIGHQLRKRYVKEHEEDETKLLSPTYVPSEIYVRSTQVQRTIQSADSQLLGLYPLGTAKKLKQTQVENSLPHISIQDEDIILKKLRDSAIQGDFQPIPVHNFGLYEDDMVAYGKCPYMVNDYLNRTDDPEVWQKYDDHFRPLIYDQIASAFNTTSDQVNFLEIYPMSDILWAEDFQGLPKRYNFSDEEWDIVRQIQMP